MKNNILTIIVICILFVSCNSTQSTMKNTTSLEGKWELNYITGPRIAFDGLFPNKKPTIIFDLKENRVSGNNSCNSYTGVLKMDGSKINFKDPMDVTRMMCMDVQGETTYMKTLQMVDSFNISEDGKTLFFNREGNMILRFDKK